MKKTTLIAALVLIGAPWWAAAEEPVVNPGEEEVTSTLKARKKGVRKKFAPHLDELYETKAFLKIVKQ